MSVAAVQESETEVELVAVALSDPGALGGVVSPGGVPNWIDTDAPDGETAVVEIVTLATGSVKLEPTARAASKKVAVPGVKSSSFDWTIDEVSGAMRTEMPFATALDDENVSKTPPGCRNSRFR